MIEGLVEFETHRELPSTSDRLRELAEAGAGPFTAVIADAQTSGRGRGGRRWVSAHDCGLWISVLLPPPPDGPPGIASIAVGVAAARAIEDVAGVEVGLKWPNDLLVSAGPLREPSKVGGILCETVRGPNGRGVVAGIGVNLRRPQHVDGAADEALVSAAFLDEVVGRRVAASELAHAVVRQLRAFADPPPNHLEEWLALAWERRDLLKGRRVRTQMAPPGIAIGLGRDGSLRVSDASGQVHTVKAGSVRLEGEGPPALHTSGEDACTS